VCGSPPYSRLNFVFCNCLLIGSFALVEDANGENNGWHACGGLGKYNQYREGYIFQANENVWPLLVGTSMKQTSSSGILFASVHEEWRHAIFDVASTVLRHIAIGLDLHPSYFSREGKMDVVNASQFHVKRYLYPASSTTEQRSGENIVALLPHRDPSVISMVIHNNENGKGLEMWNDTSKSYTEVAHCGPMFGTVLGA
jgi:hypothetical protein